MNLRADMWKQVQLGGANAEFALAVLEEIPALEYAIDQVQVQGINPQIYRFQEAGVDGCVFIVTGRAEAEALGLWPPRAAPPA